MRETDALTVVVPLQLYIKRELQVLQLSEQLLCVSATTSRTSSKSNGQDVQLIELHVLHCDQ
jgi:hypothetical protein